MYSKVKLEGESWRRSPCLFKMADFNQMYHNGATVDRVQTYGRSHCFSSLISGLHKHLLYFHLVCILSSLSLSFNFIKNKEGKNVPLQARSGPEVSTKLRFPDYMTTAQDGGKVSPTHRPPLPPGNTPGTHFLLEAELTPRP